MCKNNYFYPGTKTSYSSVFSGNIQQFSNHNISTTILFIYFNHNIIHIIHNIIQYFNHNINHNISIIIFQSYIIIIFQQFSNHNTFLLLLLTAIAYLSESNKVDFDESLSEESKELADFRQ